MKIKKVIKRIINSPEKVLVFIFRNMFFSKKISDEKYIKIIYQIIFHKKININHPNTFNEKIQWLKLYDRKKVYINMVDKYEVKKIVSSIIGEKYIIPTLGIYDNFDEINFDDLPKQFVIKCTHDSGGIFIVKDKSRLNINKIRKKINKCLKRNFYFIGREWPYKNVKPRIIIEKYMTNGCEDLVDYKVHNFNGIPKLILVCKDRYKNTGLTEDFFDLNWNHLEIKRSSYGNSTDKLVKPKKIDEIVKLSRKLSKGIPFIRTDFYIINDAIYFGELTFYPASGFEKFFPSKVDDELGALIDLPIDK